MKLRNKETGELGYLRSINWNEQSLIIMDKDGIQLAKYQSLAELNDEWEDYEELKEYYCIDWTEPDGIYKTTYMDDRDDFNKEIGNCFNTREEAEKAVEKLKAWKRLKDYNVKFNLDFVRNKIDFTYSVNNPLLSVLDGEEQIFNNMKIIFGGEA